MCTICQRGYEPFVGDVCTPTSNGRCVECPRGKFKPNTGDDRCTGCDPGKTWQSEEGQQKCNYCTQCQKGEEQSSECTVNADAVCVTCPAGTYKASLGSEKCTTCAAGQFQDEAGS